MKQRGTLVVAVTAAALVLGACSGGGENEVDSRSGQTGAEAGNDSSSEASETTSERSGSRGDERDESAESLGTSTGQHRADPNDPRQVPLRVDVTGLVRNGDLVELDLQLTNEAEEATEGESGLTFRPYSVFGMHRPEGAGGSEEWDLSEVALVDQGDRVAYLPVRDDEGVCLCSRDLGNLQVAPAESAELAATFGGAPDDLEVVDVHVPGFAPITGVEISG